MIKTKESYSFEDRGTDGQTESISEFTQRKYKRSQNYLFFKNVAIVQNYVITSPANHQSLFIIVLLTSFKNGAC